MQHLFSQTLRTSASESIQKDPKSPGMSFNAQKFVDRVFHRWFISSTQSPYFFTFRKNRGVTNIGYMELMSLIKLTNTAGEGDIQVESSGYFKQALRSTWHSLGVIEPPGSDSEDARTRFETQIHGKCDAVAEIYWNVVENLVLLDAFYGSALVFIPPDLRARFDPARICGEAGYVHSCGPVVYFRNTAKAHRGEFIRKLLTFLESLPEGSKIQMVAYCHEFFDEHDKKKQSMLHNGLGDLKIYLDKFHIGEMLFVDLLRELRAQDSPFADKLVVAKGIQQYKVERREFCEKGGSIRGSTLFVLVERSVSEEVTDPGDNQYFVCYQQTCVNTSPLIMFNEKKPGWLAPVTLPHTLCAAMLNIARPLLPDNASRELLIVDPFLGSGTVLLEAHKLRGSVNFIGCDISRMSKVIVEDNLRFFSLSGEELEKQVYKKIRGFSAYELVVSTKDLKWTPDDPDILEMPPDAADITAIFRWGMAAAKSQVKERPSIREQRELYERDFPGAFWAVFKQDDEHFVGRIVYYLCWRAMMTNMVQLAAGVTDLDSALKKEVSDFIDDLADLCEIRRTRDPSEREHRPDYTLWLQDGLYSREAILPYRLFNRTWSERRGLEAQVSELENGASVTRSFKALHKKAEDVLEGLTDKVDLIITDPPYGFNTNPAEARDFAAFYAHVVELMVGAVNPLGGQIVLCLPEVARTGQAIPFFATRRMVIRQLIKAAGDRGKHVIQRSLIRPAPRDCFTPPFYWRSQRSLTRTILHFSFGSNTHMG